MVAVKTLYYIESLGGALFLKVERTLIRYIRDIRSATQFTLSQSQLTDSFVIISTKDETLLNLLLSAILT